jgi:hypothetical protein
LFSVFNSNQQLFITLFSFVVFDMAVLIAI